MWKVGLCALVAVGCGSKSEPAKEVAKDPTTAAPKADRFGKVKRPTVSAVCAEAGFGYLATCVETELAELATAAGKVYRVSEVGDPTAAWVYVLARPDGTMVRGDGGNNGTMLDEITKALDLAATPPATLALLHAALDTEVAVVRCLPGADDKLPPDRDGKVHACAAPAIVKDGDKQVLTYVVEQFPHPRLLNRDSHWIYASRIEVREHELSHIEGRGLVELAADAPLPPSMPPRPTLTSPPDWVAAPVQVSAELSAALCQAAVAKVSGLEGQACKAYGYPSLDLPTGSLYYLANDAGQRHLIALQKPDGTIVTGYDLGATEHPLLPIIASYDPTVVPPATFFAAHLFLTGRAARILCLPGAKDVIPGVDCVAPTAVKQGEDLVVTAIVEERPFPDEHGTRPDPSVRSYTMTFGPGGGFSGGGTRLLDLRDQ